VPRFDLALQIQPLETDMTNKERAIRFGKQMQWRVDTGMFTVHQARKICDDFGLSSAKAPRLQDRLSYWARSEVPYPTTEEVA
jgi:hypothetical protein